MTMIHQRSSHGVISSHCRTNWSPKYEFFPTFSSLPAMQPSLFPYDFGTPPLGRRITMPVRKSFVPGILQNAGSFPRNTTVRPMWRGKQMQKGYEMMHIPMRKIPV